MKILHLSTHDIIGGAAIAAYRIHHGLRKLGIDSQMLVNHRHSADPSVHNIHKQTGRLNRLQVQLAEYMDKQPLYRRRIFPSTNWSMNWFPIPITKTIKQLRPHIVHIHWVGDGFLPVRAIKHIPVPIVWTFHDMWPMTGGCHYTDGCERFLNACGQCPQLQSERFQDATYHTLKAKKNHWRHTAFTVVTPSRWLGDYARNSPLFRKSAIEVIPNGLDTDIYYPRDKQTLRPLLGLPTEKRLILFSAQTGTQEKRKGFHHLVAAIEHLRTLKDVELLILGADRALQTLPLPAHYMGNLRDQLSLSLIYAAADVFVAPSEQDNLPNTVLEALASGVPCVAFGIGGMPDLITHHENGYLATPFSAQDLAQGIQWVLEHPQYEHLSAQSRAYILARHSIADIAQRYAQLYERLIKP